MRNSTQFYSDIIWDGFFLFIGYLQFSFPVKHLFIVYFQGVDLRKLPLWTLLFFGDLTVGFPCRFTQWFTWLTVEGSNTLCCPYSQPASYPLYYPHVSELVLLPVPHPPAITAPSIKNKNVSSPLPFFFPGGNKARTEDRFDEMARKTAFLHWRFWKYCSGVWGPICFYCLHLSLLYGFWLLLL